MSYSSKRRRGEREKRRRGDLVFVENLEVYFSRSRLLTKNCPPFSSSPPLPCLLIRGSNLKV
jgi:hypothetical protein